MTVYVHLSHVNPDRGDADAEAILGPFDGVQLTYGQLRETGAGDVLATIGARGWEMEPSTGTGQAFSDITFSVERPESVVNCGVVAP